MPAAPPGRTAGIVARGVRGAGWLHLCPLLLLPPLASLLGVDAVLPLVLWLTTAGLLRAGSSLLDRLVIAAMLIAGSATALGLLLSVWPWGLDPVPAAELGLLLLIGGSAATGRRFSLPLRFPARDLVLAVAALGISCFYLRPLIGANTAQRLSGYVTAEDLARHFGLYDSIRNLGGYAFLHSAQNRPILQPGMSAYPQGSHFDLALLDRFLHPGLSTPVAELGQFLLLTTLVCALFVFVVCWAACRVAGPRLGAAAALPLVLGITFYLCAVEGTAMLQNGFLSELFGLTLFSALLALAIRPVDRPREQLLLLSSLLIGISFGYYLWVPVAAAVAVVSLLVHRRSGGARRGRLTLPAVGLVTGVLMVVPVAANWSVVNSAASLDIVGGITPVTRHLLWPLTAVAALLVLLALLRGERTARVTGSALALVGAAAGAVMLYQLHTLGQSSYYYEKMLHQVAVTALVCLGSAGVLLPEAAGATFRDRARTGLLSLAASALVLVGGVYNAQPDGAATTTTAATAKARDYLRGSDDEAAVARLALADARLPAAGGQPVPTLVMATGLRSEFQGNYYASVWLNVLTRTAGQAGSVPSWAFVPVERVQGIPHTLSGQLDTLTGPLRIVSDSPAVAAAVAAYEQSHPDAVLTLDRP